MNYMKKQILINKIFKIDIIKYIENGFFLFNKFLLIFNNEKLCILILGIEDFEAYLKAIDFLKLFQKNINIINIEIWSENYKNHIWEDWYRMENSIK